MSHEHTSSSVNSGKLRTAGSSCSDTLRAGAIQVAKSMPSASRRHSSAAGSPSVARRRVDGLFISASGLVLRRQRDGGVRLRGSSHLFGGPVASLVLTVIGSGAVYQRPKRP